MPLSPRMSQAPDDTVRKGPSAHTGRMRFPPFHYSLLPLSIGSPSQGELAAKPTERFLLLHYSLFTLTSPIGSPSQGELAAKPTERFAPTAFHQNRRGEHRSSAKCSEFLLTRRTLHVRLFRLAVFFARFSSLRQQPRPCHAHRLPFPRGAVGEAD